MNKKMKIAVAAVWLSVVGLGIGKYASAQLEPPPAPDDAGAPPRTAPRFGGPGGFGGPPGGFGALLGGGTQMAVSGNNLFILRGGTIFRVNAQTLKVEAQGDLPQPQMPGAPGGQIAR
jgi:hypothetical protein